MKKLKTLVFCIFFNTILFFSCEFNVSTANLSDLKVCSGVNEKKLCNQDQPVLDGSIKELYATAILNNAPSDTRVDIIFNYTEGGLVRLDSQAVTAQGNLPVYYKVPTPANGWRKGKYEFIFKLNTDNSKPLRKEFVIDVPLKVTDFAICNKQIITQGDKNCLAETPVFDQGTEKFFAEVVFNATLGRIKAKISWYYVENKRELIDAVNLDVKDRKIDRITSNLSRPKNGWPKGKYEVVVETDLKEMPSVSKSFLVN